MNVHPRGRSAPLLRLALLFTALATTGSARAEEDGPRLALDGYCPVSIVGDKQWRKGDPEIAHVLDGREYRFASEDHRKRFRAQTESFVPALGGDCIVTRATDGERVPGRIRFGAFYGGRLFLFAGDAEREDFRARTSLLGNADLAYDGRCPVALADGRTVRGETKFVVHRDGVRYRLASKEARATFLADPGRFTLEANRDELAAAERLVEATGKASCAYCDHEVWPLLTKDELGLAIEGDDGHLYVVEHADTRFPKLYLERFGGNTLTVKGREIRRDGKTIWLVPESLEEGS